MSRHHGRDRVSRNQPNLCSSLLAEGVLISTDSRLMTEDMMRHLRQLCIGLILVLTISISAIGGDMPQPPAASSEMTVQGDMGQPLTEIILAALKTALSLM